MAWTCSKCTFINPSSQKTICQICGSSYSFASSFSASASASPSIFPSPAQNWSCKSCTFLNSKQQTSCEVCGTKVSVSSLSSFEEFTGIDKDLDSSVGSIFFPLRRCTKRKNESIHGVDDLDACDDIKAPCVSPAAPNDDSNTAMLKIMTYNVWFREDLELQKRMNAIGELILLHFPDIICFQEVTPNIYDIFQQSGWWKSYKCSISRAVAHTKAYFCMLLSKLPVKSFHTKPFKNSVMGRELCIAEIESLSKKSLVIATSHLESPCPSPPKWNQMYSNERVDQAKEALAILKNYPNAIFCGDMNWDDKTDGEFPLPKGFVDAWTYLKPGEVGWTYDTKSNLMLSGNRCLQKRLDRFTCNLCNFGIHEIHMIGRDPIAGVSYCKEKKRRKEVQNLVLPVLPSDHYGLILLMNAL